MTAGRKSSPDPSSEAHGGAEFMAASVKGHALSVAPGTVSPGNVSTVSGRKSRSKDFSVDELADGILSGDRVILGRAITLIESAHPAHARKALDLLQRVLPHSGRSVRVGITGVPGVGKSTFIEALGLHLTARGYRLAVLAIDPSSRISKGSIMGDKTRMERLSADAAAFIRPSPSAGSLGGVARKTREAMLVCEAAGFDAVFVETVGVGQSETVVHSMVDCFLLLMLAGAGDQLQGIKRGIMELADAVVINKADGDNILAAQRARGDYETALHLMRAPSPDWSPPVLTCSSLTAEGIDGVWDTIARFHSTMSANGAIAQRRRRQSLDWMEDTIREALRDRFQAHPLVSSLLPELERRVLDGTLPAVSAARQLLDAFFTDQRGKA
jgi:LAO/AO transport system kinase